jgi:feruloyl-CoA synthase
MLVEFAARATGSANRIERIVLVDELPSLDIGEVTDKGSINQRAVLNHRKALVEALYAARSGAAVISANQRIANVA